MTIRPFGYLAIPLVFFGCSHGVATGDSAPSFAAVAHPVAGETSDPPTAQTVEIYHEVFKFYRPGRGRIRLLDRTLLSVDSAVEKGGEIDATVAEAMLENLGKSFCVRDDRRTCNGQTRGGTLRVSPLYRSPDDRIRIAVRYTSMEPNGPDFSTTQVFLLEHTERGWTILGRR